MNFTIKVKLTASSKLLDAINLLAGGVSKPVEKSLPGKISKAISEETGEELVKIWKDNEKAIEKTATTRTRKVKDEVKEDPKPEVKEPIEEPVKDEFKEANTSDEPVTIETVRAAVQEKAAGGKRDAVKALLTKYNVARVTDLVEADYSAFLKEVTAITLEKVKA